MVQEVYTYMCDVCDPRYPLFRFLQSCEKGSIFDLFFDSILISNTCSMIHYVPMSYFRGGFICCNLGVIQVGFEELHVAASSDGYISDKSFFVPSLALAFSLSAVRQITLKRSEGSKRWAAR